MKQHEEEHIRQRVTETVSEPKSQEKLTKEKNGTLSQKKIKGGRRTYKRVGEREVSISYSQH